MKKKQTDSQNLDEAVHQTVKERSEVTSIDKWDVEKLYPSLKAWEKEYTLIAENSKKPRWKIFENFKNNLSKDEKTLKLAIETILDISRKLTTLYTYAHLRHDEDITNDLYKTAYNKALSALHDFGQEISWFEPELLTLPEKTLSKFLKSKTLTDYKFYIEKIIRIKEHTLSKESEELLALSAKALQAPHMAFSSINDADFKFKTIKDKKEKDHELTLGSYSIYLRDSDRVLRKNAFLTLQGKYQAYQNTLAELLIGEVNSHIFVSKARRYSSSLEAALFSKNIEVSVYHALIKAVNGNLKSLHKYIALRSKILEIPKLHLYDLYVPLTKNSESHIPYKVAEELIIESVKPLGASYQNLLKKGLQKDHWVDRYENKNKRSGAYSSGCYDSMPYILMNYKNQIRDLFTLAHEAGHSMHSLLTHTHQPYQYGDYPIFLAEVASTFNEELLMRLMLERAKNKEERIFLINQKIEDIRGTLFRQTMFAEFELWLHETAEKNIPLTPTLMNEMYRTLNRRYFGDSVELDKESDVEWARIPHFYYNFYLYQYATGISAALALADNVCSGGLNEQKAYLSFLKSGSSRYPIPILKSAGVDMTSEKPVVSAIKKFNSLVDLLAKELE